MKLPMEISAKTPISSSGRQIWYQCQRCAACCKWPGDVIVEEDEVAIIAAHVGLSVFDFVQRHTRLRANRAGLSLTEKPNGECEFLDGLDCRINAVKPRQCRGFPNEWNFPGWQEKCEAIPVMLANGGES